MLQGRGRFVRLVVVMGKGLLSGLGHRSIGKGPRSVPDPSSFTLPGLHDPVTQDIEGGSLHYAHFIQGYMEAQTLGR